MKPPRLRFVVRKSSILIALSVFLDTAAPAQVVVVPAMPQAPVILIDGQPVPVEGTEDPVMPLPPGLPSVGRSNTNRGPADKQLQELLQLQFDRRPQEVLQTISRQLDGSVQQTNQVQQFRDDVVAGRWSAVGEFISKLPEAQRAQVYRHVLTGLQRTAGPGMPGQPGGPMPMPDMPPGVVMNPGMPGMPPGMMTGPVLLPDDVLALADIAPGELNDEFIPLLGQLLSRALSKGNYVEPLVARLEQGTAKLGGSEPAARAAAVKLLVAAGRIYDAGKLLPPLEPAQTQLDLEILDLHARYNLEASRQRKETNALMLAWDLSQQILAITNASTGTNKLPTLREQSLQRALEILPQLPGQQGTNWLHATFNAQPARGMAVLAVAAAPAQDFRNADARQRTLTSQSRAVAALMTVATNDMSQWKTPLTVMALNWAQEADLSRTRWVDRSRPNPNYGYEYYDPEEQMRMQRFNDPNQLQPISPANLLRLVPNERWLSLVDPTLAPRIDYLYASLQMKLEEPLKALETVFRLATNHPARASELANELLGAWARAKNPNANADAMMRMRYGPYGPIYYGGNPYGMGGQGISLTRAMQNRNLLELADIMEGLRKLNLQNLDESGVVNAFTSAHSQSEVFRVEDIERVFGPTKAMKVETLAGLLQTMRTRLATSWRSLRVQQDNKTKRTDKDIEAEVTRGYELLTALQQDGLAQWPDNWRLHMVQAIAWFDFAEFQYGKKVDLPIYVEKRERSFKEFENATALYAGQLAQIEPDKFTADVFVNWFNANLGASDLAYVTRQQEPSTNNLARIRDTILQLPDNAGPRHMELFATAMNESLNTIKPELKPRYLRAALRVTGEIPAADEIRKLARYYDDLLGEIALDVRLDGDALVGHDAPFGVFITLRHSAEVERESGGFARYLQSQNQPYYASRYGNQRNAREDFDKQLREKLSDTFDIGAITFADEKVQSRGIGRPGWRETPLAYVLLKAKDGAVDRLPSFHFDLDFFDRRGQVILPVESSIVLIDARPSKGAPRPVSKVVITQVLDDREAASGKLTLDIRATARGVLPELRELVDVDLPGFTIVKTNDSGSTLSKLDTEDDDLAALSERSWVFNLEPAERGKGPAVFHFPKPKSKDLELSYKRYADADLVEVKPELAVAGLQLRPDLTWLWLLLASVVAIGGGMAAFMFRRRHAAHSFSNEDSVYTVPSQVTPFNALKLLRRLQNDTRIQLPADRRTELASTIQQLEHGYFARPTNGGAHDDLARVLQSWLPTRSDN